MDLELIQHLYSDHIFYHISERMRSADDKVLQATDYFELK